MTTQELGEAVLRLTTDDSGLTEGIKTAKQKADELSDAFKNVGIAITAALGFSEKLLKAWADDEVAATRLGASVRIMIGNYESITKSLLDYSEELQRSSGFSHEMIENQMAQAVVLGRTSEQVKTLSLAATELANAGIMPLDMAFKQLDMTYEGNLRQLGRMFPELKNLTTEQLANGDAVKIIEARVSGMNEAMMNTIQGGMRGLHNSFAELADEMGRVVAVFAGPTMQALSGLINKVVDFIKSTMDLSAAMKAVHEGTATEAQRVIVMTDALGKANEAFDLTVNRIKTLTGNFGENADGLVRLRKELTEQSNTIKAYVNALAEIEKKNNALRDHEIILQNIAGLWKEQEKQQKINIAAFGELTKANITWADVYIDRLRAMESATQGFGGTINKTWTDVVLKSVREVDKVQNKTWDDYAQYVARTNGKVIANVETTTEAIQKFYKGTYKEISDVVNETMKALSSISSLYYQGQNNALDVWYQKQIAALGDMTNATQAQTDAKAKIDKEYADKQSDLKKQQWASDRDIALANAVISTAESVAKSLSSLPWPWDLIPAGIAAALGAVQIGLIAGEPEPAFAKGGDFTVPPGYPDDSYPMHVQSGEHVSVTPAGQGADTPIHVVVNLDSQPILDAVTRGSRNRRVLISSRGVIP